MATPPSDDDLKRSLAEEKSAREQAEEDTDGEIQALSDRVKELERLLGERAEEAAALNQRLSWIERRTERRGRPPAKKTPRGRR